MINEEKRLYVVVAATIQVLGPRTVVQPPGRQVAQACHAVSKLRMKMMVEAKRTPSTGDFSLTGPITTIVLQARDANELYHVNQLLFKKKILFAVFLDTNPEYGPGAWMTATCTEPVTKRRVEGILDYLPLWGAQ